MKKLVLILMSFTLAIQVCLAEDTGRNPFPRVTYGLEWGYTSTLYSYTHLNYRTEVGYRMDIKDGRFHYTPNGELLASVGYNLNGNMNLSFITGYAGLDEGCRVVPLSLRGTYYIGECTHDRFFTFLDGGIGIDEHLDGPLSWTGKAGAGYRVHLSRSINLDFLLDIRIVKTSPDIKDPDSGVNLPDGYILRHNRRLDALTLSMALYF